MIFKVCDKVYHVNSIYNKQHYSYLNSYFHPTRNEFIIAVIGMNDGKIYEFTRKCLVKVTPLEDAMS